METIIVNGEARAVMLSPTANSLIRYTLEEEDHGSRDPLGFPEQKREARAIASGVFPTRRNPSEFSDRD